MWNLKAYETEAEAEPSVGCGAADPSGQKLPHRELSGGSDAPSGGVLGYIV